MNEIHEWTTILQDCIQIELILEVVLYILAHNTSENMYLIKHLRSLDQTTCSGEYMGFPSKRITT
jgi:hypothetical protein